MSAPARVLAMATVAVLNAMPVYAESEQGNAFRLFAYLTGSPTARMVAYSPSDGDPRFNGSRQLTRTSIEADLKAIRPVFDGLILYGFDRHSTPLIVEVAKELRFRAVVLGIWDPRSTQEVDGVATLADHYHEDMILGVIVGNEGIQQKRYQPDDLNTAASRLLKTLPSTIPITTSEPLFVCLNSGFVRHFGDFLAVNLHPVWERPKMSADEAAVWTREQAMKLALKARKPVLVKETGFPHGGKEGFTPRAQQLFWEAYLRNGVLARAQRNNNIWVYHGVAFEAFDLPWKASQSNIPMEQSWGLFSTDRRAYPALLPWRKVAE